jgi:methylmalonyl-CoA mutase
MTQATREDWLKLVEKTLKGADFDKRLVSRTTDGIAVQPLYPSAEVVDPAVRRRKAHEAGRPWEIRARTRHPDPAHANRELLSDLEGGAASVLIALDPEGGRGVAIAAADDLRRTLDGVLLDLAPVALDARFLGPVAADWLAEAAARTPEAPLALHMDPIGAFAVSGASPGPAESHLVSAATVGARLSQTFPNATAFLASGRAAHEAGGSEAQELGFAAASALAYARALARAGLPIGEAFRRIVLGLSADADYFVTIAKLRAARAIWGRLTTACGAESPAVVEARSSARMLAQVDPWVNMLRLTAAGLGAAAGGADALVLDAFTDAIGLPTAFARRQARNTQLVLMEEAHLGRVADPAGGAGLIESLTDEFARAGWSFMQAIEAQGGVLRALEGGFIAAEVAKARDLRRAEYARRKAGLIGVSEFPNLSEAAVAVEAVEPATFARSAPSGPLPGPASACEPLAPIRWAEPFEQLRERGLAAQSRVYLAVLGPVAEHAARAGFARNVLAVGGMITAEGAPEAWDGARLTVLCGSDERYAAEAAEAARALKARGAPRVWLAGRPGEQEAALRAAGVDAFIFAGADVLETLEQALAD